MDSPFLKKYLMKNDKKEDIFHSSAYGVAQNGAGMGAASTQSFQERRAIEQNRQNIGGYNQSRIANGAAMNAPRPKTYTPPSGAGGAGTGVSGGARPMGGAPRPTGHR